MDLFRETAFGQVIRFVTRNKLLQYPEEKPGFSWAPLDEIVAELNKQPGSESDFHDEGQDEEPLDTIRETPGDPEKVFEPIVPEDNEKERDLEKNDHPGPVQLDTIATAEDRVGQRHVPATTRSRQSGIHAVRTQQSDIYHVTSRSSTREYTQERLEAERTMEAERKQSMVIAPTKTSDGRILVDWYTTDDPANPQNWPGSRKILTQVQLAFYSMAVYGASSMYVSGEQGVMERFHVGYAPAAMGLAIYVIGYGVGPLVWAPLSEIPAIGRNLVYIPTFFLFVILSIPTAVVDNYAGLLVLRFLTGFFGSPCLANGGATIGDMYSLIEIPIYLSSWTVACFWGPAIGPLISGFAVQAKGWRWGLWEILWFTAPIWVVMFFVYPETSADNILRRRAQRLRKLTGCANIKSSSEIAQENLSVSNILIHALIKPAEISIKDPAVGFTNLYTALVYGIYYSFFEVFPLVYPPIYHFNLGEVGLTFLTIGIGCVIAVTGFISYQVYYLIPDIKKNGLRAPEHRLVPALFGVIGMPVGYFMFGWTARHGVPWIVSLIGVGILVVANFLIFQCVFIYLPLSYPQYAASLFAANDLSRSLFAAGCVLFSRPMFLNLGIGGGVSLLGGLGCLGVFGMFYLWKYGAWLRSRSTFAAK